MTHRQMLHRRAQAFKRAGLLVEADDIARANAKREARGEALLGLKPKCPPKNALRHSFVTYHVALHRNPGKTALIVSPVSTEAFAKVETGSGLPLPALPRDRHQGGIPDAEAIPPGAVLCQRIATTNSEQREVKAVDILKCFPMFRNEIKAAFSPVGRPNYRIGSQPLIPHHNLKRYEYSLHQASPCMVNPATVCGTRPNDLDRRGH